MGHLIISRCLTHCIDFLVLFEGEPVPKVEWLRDGKLVEESDRVEVITKDGTSTLRIKDTTIDDEAAYKCRATNEAGVVESAGMLYVDDLEETVQEEEV